MGRAAALGRRPKASTMDSWPWTALLCQPWPVTVARTGQFQPEFSPDPHRGSGSSEEAQLWSWTCGDRKSQTSVRPHGGHPGPHHSPGCVLGVEEPHWGAQTAWNLERLVGDTVAKSSAL